MDAWILKKYCIIFCITFVYITKDTTTDAISCYSCSWGSDELECVMASSMGSTLDSLLEKSDHGQCFVRSKPKDVLEHDCAKKECQSANSKCSKFRVFDKSSSSSTALAVLYGCISNPATGDMDIDAPGNLNVKGNFCSRDLCNGGKYSSVPSIFALFILTVFILLRYTSELA